MKTLSCTIMLLLLLNSCYVYKEYTQKLDEQGNELPPPTKKERLEQNKMFKIDIADKTYKIQVDKWEQDSLVAKINFKEDQIKKFHHDDIVNVRDRVFNGFGTNGLTIAAYAVGIVGLILLL